MMSKGPWETGPCLARSVPDRARPHPQPLAAGLTQASTLGGARVLPPTEMPATD